MVEREQPQKEQYGDTETQETIDWVEVRRETVRDLLRPINQLSLELADLERKKPNRNKWTRAEVQLEKVFLALIEAGHLTVGRYACYNFEVSRTHWGIGKRIPGYEEGMRG